jgi:hypothetical protein
MIPFFSNLIYRGENISISSIWVVTKSYFKDGKIVLKKSTEKNKGKKYDGKIRGGGGIRRKITGKSTGKKVREKESKGKSHVNSVVYQQNI